MSISRERKKQLRRKALSIVWQVLDAATREVDLQRVDGEMSDEEALFVSEVIDCRAQRAFVEYSDYKEKNASR